MKKQQRKADNALRKYYRVKNDPDSSLFDIWDAYRAYQDEYKKAEILFWNKFHADNAKKPHFSNVKLG